MIPGKNQLISILLFLSFTRADAQVLRTFNQNSARSNYAKTAGMSSNWDFGINAGTSFSTRSNEGSLFRGNSIATKMLGNYNFGVIGLGISGGIVPGTVSSNAVNDFITERKYQQGQLQITTSNPFNGYLLFGPTFHFGNRVMINAGLQGGMFMNDPGTLTIMQPGAARALYHFEGAEKKLFPGLSGSLSLAYPVNKSLRFLVSTDYLHSGSSIRLLDPQRGIDIATEQNRTVKLVTAAVGIIKSFGEKPAAAGTSIAGEEGSRISNVRKSVPVQNHAINTKGTGASNGRMMNNENCGPVTLKTTNADGSTDEKTFACPADAAAYERSTNSAPANRIIHRDLAARNVLTGRLSRVEGSNSFGIVTNTNINNEGLSTAKQTPKKDFGDRMKAGLGRAASPDNEKIKKYGLIFADQGSSYTSELGYVKENPLYSSNEISGSPLYNGNTMSVNNPMFEGKRTGEGGSPGNTVDENCDGIAGVDVFLVDPQSRATIASTKTGRCGDFFFANVPEGEYIVKLYGTFLSKKGYDFYAKSKVDMMGMIQQTDARFQLLLNTGEEGDGMQQKAGISTSRSNIRCKSITVIEADLNGDGTNESTKILMEFSDGSTKDVTATSRISSSAVVKKVTVRGWNPEKKEEITGTAGDIVEYTIDIDSNNGILLGSQYSNGTKKQSQATAKLRPHPNVVQYTIPLDENDPGIAARPDQKIKTKSNIKNDRLAGNGNPAEDDDPGIALRPDQKIKTKSNIKNDRMAGNGNPAEDDDPGIALRPDQKIKTKSNIKNDRMAAGPGIKILTVSAGDTDGDGINEKIIGAPLVPGGTVISAAMSPGDPIPGLDVKLGKNPGGQLIQSSGTNENGEFEFRKLDAGDYTITVSETILLDDETLVWIGEDETMKKQGITVVASQNTQSLRTVQADDDAAKTKSNAVPVKWVAPESLKAAINTSHSNIKNLLSAIDDLQVQLDADAGSEAAAINTGHSNIKNLRLAIYDLQSTMAEMRFMEKETAMAVLDQKQAAVNTGFNVLKESLNRLGTKFSSISNVLKTRHETAMGSIRNIK